MTKEEIRKICHEHSIKNYTINSDMSIDVNGIVNISHKYFKHIPLQFNYVNSWFSCFECINLISLKGSTRECNHFECSACDKLDSLDYAPLKGKLLDYLNKTKIRECLTDNTKISDSVLDKYLIKRILLGQLNLIDYISTEEGIKKVKPFLVMKDFDLLD